MSLSVPIQDIAVHRGGPVTAALVEGFAKVAFRAVMKEQLKQTEHQPPESRAGLSVSDLSSQQDINAVWMRVARYRAVQERIKLFTSVVINDTIKFLKESLVFKNNNSRLDSSINWAELDQLRLGIHKYLASKIKIPPNFLISDRVWLRYLERISMYERRGFTPLRAPYMTSLWVKEQWKYNDCVGSIGDSESSDSESLVYFTQPEELEESYFDAMEVIEEEDNEHYVDALEDLNHSGSYESAVHI